MTKRITLVITCVLLIFTILINLTGCGTKVAASSNLMDGIIANKVTPSTNLNSNAKEITEFATNLFKNSSQKNENTLVSPLSLLCALAMTANGAKGDTLSQIEQTLGLPIDTLNQYVYSYVNSLPGSDKYKVNIANSIWFTDHERFTVNNSFLQNNADYYNADIYKIDFEKSAVKTINDWINNSTDGMIPKILDKIPEQAVMYLINALVFDAEWAKMYTKEQVESGKFYPSGSAPQTTEFMYSNENKYIKDSNAQGFIKYYYEGKYAFVAILPDQDVSLNDYIADLNGAKIQKLISNAKETTVEAAIPKFESEYSSEMCPILEKMGIKDAFKYNKANFEALGKSDKGNIYIDNILHKTFISVTEKGTKAGAASSVQMADKLALDPTMPKQIYLNRPFLYMIIDCNTNIPLFIGQMTDINK